MIFKKPAVHVPRLSFDDFYIIEQVGEGTYGRVFKARNVHTNKLSALKVVFPTEDDEGLPFTAVREIKYLQMLSDNPNVIKLEGTFFTRDGELVLAFEYMENDLSGLLSLKNLQFSPAQTKCLFKQVLEGLHQCHRAGIMHRDIKAANLLLNNGELKMADFGLASNYLRRRTFSTNVVTLWYRAPELLLGVNAYGPKVDIWSAGCLFIELLTRQSPFPGREEKHQLELIVRTCGTPDERNWPGVTKIEGYKQLQGLMGHKNRLREVFGKFDPRALNLLSRMLSLNPADRPTASEALDHDYFWTDPVPCKATELPHYPAMHEYEAKKTRQSERQPKRQKVTGYAPNVPVAPLRSQPYPPHNAGYPQVPLSVPHQPPRGDYPPLPSSHYTHLPYPSSKPMQYGHPPARQNLSTGPKGWGPAAHGTHPPAAGNGLLPTPVPGHPPRPTGYAGVSSSYPIPRYGEVLHGGSRHRQPSSGPMVASARMHPHQHHSMATSGLPPHYRSVGGAQPQSSSSSSLPPSTGLRGGYHHAVPRETNRPPTSSARALETGPRHDMPPHLASGYNRPPAGAHRPVHHTHLGHSIITEGHHASTAYRTSVHKSHVRATLSSVEHRMGLDTTGKRKREATALPSLS